MICVHRLLFIVYREALRYRSNKKTGKKVRSCHLTNFPVKLYPESSISYLPKLPTLPKLRSGQAVSHIPYQEFGHSGPPTGSSGQRHTKNPIQHPTSNIQNPTSSILFFNEPPLTKGNNHRNPSLIILIALPESGYEISFLQPDSSKDVTRR